MKEVKIFLVFLGIFLFVGNYSICDYFYYNDEVKDIKAWWGLKSNIYAIILALVLLSYSLGLKNRYLRFILEIGVGFSVSNVIDKVFFDVINFTKSDVIMIVITFGVAIYNFKRYGRKNK